MNADGSKQTRLSYNSADARFSVWSPDGKLVAFTSARDGTDKIDVMDADGSEQTRLTNDPSGDYSGSWHP